MTTSLNKPVSRVSSETVRDMGKYRRLVVTLFPNGTIGLRPEGTRRTEVYPIDKLYDLALKARVYSERAAKKAAKGKAK